MKCLVTGGAGFIGSNLVDKLIEKNYEVIIIDNLSTGKKENINPKAKFYNRDISIMDNFSMFQDVDVVFHTAALARVQPSIEDPVSYDKVNVGGTLKVLKACVDYNVKRFVFSSSSSVYGDIDEKDLPTSEETPLNPISPYALHKLIGEQYCKLFSEIYNLETACLRYFNVYGNRMSLEGAYKLVIPIFTEQRLNNNPMTINGDGEQRRDFTYVDDVVDANIKCAEYPLELNGDIFNIGNGDSRSVNEIADMIGGDRKHLDPVIEPKATLANNEKAKRVLKFNPSMDIEDWMPVWKKDMGL
jgi:UDP-glucose 4-epimerase